MSPHLHISHEKVIKVLSVLVTVPGILDLKLVGGVDGLMFLPLARWAAWLELPQAGQGVLRHPAWWLLGGPRASEPSASRSWLSRVGMSSSTRFVTRGRLCLASDGPDLLVGAPTQLTENVHRTATRRGCGLSWSPSQPRPAALAALWESALNTDDDLGFSPETMKQVRVVSAPRWDGPK